MITAQLDTYNLYQILSCHDEANVDSFTQNA